MHSMGIVSIQQNAQRVAKQTVIQLGSMSVCVDGRTRSVGETISHCQEFIRLLKVSRFNCNYMIILFCVVKLFLFI